MLDIRPLSPEYAVSPQIDKADIPTIAKEGFKSVLCNRPDLEIGPENCCDEMRATVEKAGLVFADNPFDHSQFGETVIQNQADLIDSLPKPILAYCASGTRCTIVWAFTQAGKRPVADILADARTQGYALDHLGPSLERFALSR